MTKERAGMIEDDEGKPRRRQMNLPDLTGWSIDELEAYQRHLDAEKARAQAEIEKKQSMRSAAEALFKKPKGAG